MAKNCGTKKGQGTNWTKIRKNGTIGSELRNGGQKKQKEHEEPRNQGICFSISIPDSKHKNLAFGSFSLQIFISVVLNMQKCIGWAGTDCGPFIDYVLSK